MSEMNELRERDPAKGAPNKLDGPANGMAAPAEDKPALDGAVMRQDDSSDDEDLGKVNLKRQVRWHYICLFFVFLFICLLLCVYVCFIFDVIWLVKGPYVDHILIPQGSTGSCTFFDIKWKPIFFWLQIQNLSFKFFAVVEIWQKMWN